MNQKVKSHNFVSGRVQGVYFREKTRKLAQELGVFGWVRNLPDGRVKAVFEGEKENVEKIIKWSKRGPFWAKVKNLELNFEEYKDEFKNFEIKYD